MTIRCVHKDTIAKLAVQKKTKKNKKKHVEHVLYLKMRAVEVGLADVE